MVDVHFPKFLLLVACIYADESGYNCSHLINVTRTTDVYTLDVSLLNEYIEGANARFLSNLTNVLAAIDKKLASYPNVKPRDCQDIQKMGLKTTGVYTIYPGSGINAIRVRCDMDSPPGGWTVFQRRISSSEFYKTWNEYQVGFGDLTTNFWLGNQQIYLISSQDWYQLRVEMTNLDDEFRYADYQVFSIGDAKSRYELFVDGFSGTAGDSLTGHSGFKFTTKDRDYDIDSRNCAQIFLGGWWYSNCHSSNLNGDYGNTNYAQGPVWRTFTGYYSPLKKMEMKMRRGKNDST